MVSHIQKILDSFTDDHIRKVYYADDLATAGNTDIGTKRIPESAHEPLITARKQRGADYTQWERPDSGYARNGEHIHYLDGKPYAEKRHGQIKGNALWHEPGQKVNSKPGYMVTKTEEPLYKHIQGSQIAGTWGI